MEFIPAKCPSCGGSLMLPKDREDAICTYCGSRFLLKNTPTKQAHLSLEGMFQLANNALQNGNYIEAYDYFTRILEYEPQSGDAWMTPVQEAVL
ncbi:MAG: hypothetical protein MUO31_03785 [Thermodesulfovibrionales bacterium]|nr:hypothetical protein [Thermodesulfovibrionales bacterium]